MMKYFSRYKKQETERHKFGESVRYKRKAQVRGICALHILVVRGLRSDGKKRA